MEESVSIYPGMKPPELGPAENSEDMSSNEDAADYLHNSLSENSPLMTDTESRPDELLPNAKRLADDCGEISSRKRRKQSNPVRVSTISRNIAPDKDNDKEATTGNTGEVDSVVKCSYCGGLFGGDLDLQAHIQQSHLGSEFNQGSEENAPDSIRDGSPKESESLALSLPSSMANQMFVMNYHNGMTMPVVTTGSGSVSASMVYGMDMRVAVSQPQVSNGGTGMRIFNPEAYCDLCNKEFCNKYFLKTHKANKHGIYSEFSPTVPQYLSSFYGGVGMDVPPTSMPPTPPSNLSVTESSVVPPDPKPVEELPSTPVGTKKGMVDPEAYCELCKKEFCNKYFLKKHKQNIHGIAPSTPGSTGSTGSITKKPPTKPQPITPEALPKTPSMASLIPISTPEPATSQGDSSQDASAGEINGVITDLEAYCEICKKQFCNKYFLRSHKLNMHGMGSGNLSGRSNYSMSLVSPTMVPTPRMVPPAILWNPGKISPHGLQPVDDKVPPPDMPNLMSVSEAVCDICQKAFHNIFYLHQHKLTKHSGMLDEAPTIPQSNGGAVSPSNSAPHAKSVDGQEETQVYTCGICQQEFANKDFLQIHIFNFHGIMPGSEEKSGKDHAVKKEMTEEMRDAMVSQHMQEAFAAKQKEQVICDICNREVCNKYFLRAHKIQQHGVLSSGDEASSIPSNQPADSLSPGQRALSSEDVGRAVQQSIMGERTRHMSADMLAGIKMDSQQHISEDKFGEMMKMDSIQDRMAFNMAVAAGMPSLVPSDLRTKPGQVGVVDPESYCSICKKEFCSKYFLKTHKLNIHGIQPDMTPTSQGNKSVYLQSTSTASNGSIKEASKVAESVGNPQPPKTAIFSGRNFCDICNKELCNKYFLKTHMLKMHGIFMEDCKVSNPSATNPIATPPSLANLPPPKPESAKNPSFIVGCNLCSKEFANRYFLDMHRMNAHGILPERDEEKSQKDEQVPDNSSVKSGDSTGTPNRYFEHYSEVCHICDRRFKSIKWLHNHLMTDHGEVLKEQQLNSNIPPSGETKACNICGACFKDFVSLQIHLIKDHKFDLKTGQPEMAPPFAGHHMPDSMSQLPHWQQDNFNQRVMEWEWQMGINPGRKGVRAIKKRLYSCSSCPFSTRLLPNLYAHEKQHRAPHFQGKKYICKYCNRSYRNQPSLARHLLLHESSNKMIEPSGANRHGPTEHGKSFFHQPGKVKRFRCSQCGTKFMSKQQCRTHIKETHKKVQQPMIEVYNCKKCDFTTFLFSTVREHLQKVHSCEVNAESYDVVKKMQTGGQNETHSSPSSNKENPTHIPSYKNSENGCPSQDEDFIEKKEISKPPICYATPFNLNSQTSFIMQPFIMKEANVEESSMFVTSLVYLPVRSKVLSEVKSAFTLTPTEH